MWRVFFIAALAPVGVLSSVPGNLVPRSDANDLLQTRQHAPLEPGHGNGTWLGWGADIYNNRLAAPDVKVDASNVASLSSVCKLDYSPYGISAAPLVINRIAYYPTWNGLLVALDYLECSVLWQTNISDIVLAYKPVPEPILNITGALVRTTPVIDGHVLYVATQANALLLAIDKRGGKLLDTIQINAHPLAIVTMSPTAWRGRIFVGSSSAEESAAAAIPDYACCSFIGNMNGLTFKHGHFTLLWTQAMAPQGTEFSGVAVWGSQPPIDPVRNQVFIGTGNVYTTPESYEVCRNQTANTTTSQAPNTTDPCGPAGLYQESIIAFDIITGQIKWFHELNPIDAWTVACIGPLKSDPSECPPNPGPDADFGMAPTFVPGSPNSPSGKDTIVIGQKNGNLYALSAETGTIFWATATSPGGTSGGLVWGIAVDDTSVYYTAENSQRQPWQLKDGTKLSNSAFGAASLTTGEILWETAVPNNDTSVVPPSVANDVVLTGVGGPYVAGSTRKVGPGSFVSLNKKTGGIIKKTVLDTYFQGGIAAVNDYVLFGTGYDATKTGSFNVWKVGK